MMTMMMKKKLSKLMYANIKVSKNVMLSPKIKPSQPLERPDVPILAMLWPSDDDDGDGEWASPYR